MLNVSEIAEKLKGVRDNNPELGEVWIHGKIEAVKRPSNRCYFTLKDNGGEIECVIFQRNRNLFSRVEANDTNDVFVKGGVDFYRQKSEYRFVVTNINLDTPNETIVCINTFRNIIVNNLQLQDVQIQGKITKVSGSQADNIIILNLKDVASTGKSSDAIQCPLPQAVVSNLPFTPSVKQKVRVSGNVGIFSSLECVYQIIIDSADDIELIRSSEDLKSVAVRCCECDQHNDGEFELCPTCHYARIDHEGIVIGGGHPLF